MPAVKSAARAAENPSVPHGHGLRFDGGGGNLELAVENVSCIAVPARTGVTGFGLKAHDDFAGAPTHVSVNFWVDPLEPKAVRLMGTLCPATTAGAVEVTTIVAVLTVWFTAADVSEA